MTPRSNLAIALIVFATLAGQSSAQTQEKLDPESLKAALRTTTIEEHDYIAFLVTLVDQQRLPRVVIDTSLRWARNKTYLQFQFFKRAAIAQADRAGITLPGDTPPLRRDIHGRVVQRVGPLDVPIPYVAIEVVGAEIKHKITTRANIKGEFTLDDLPWGVYRVEAHGGAAQLFRTISVQMKLPFLPNDPTIVTLRFR